MAAVYSREIANKVLTLSASGWTYDFLFVLFDYETETMWYDMPDGTGLNGIDGFYADWSLSNLGSTVTSWSSWVADHPDTLYMVSR